LLCVLQAHGLSTIPPLLLLLAPGLPLMLLGVLRPRSAAPGPPAGWSAQALLQLPH
jgi:hypothetical protein